MKINQLTFTRFIAAVSIVIFHYKSSMYPFNQGFFKTIFNNANVGVSYFFILSGFVMIIAYGKDKPKIKTKDYYLNRIARIYPMYLFALALTIVAFAKNNEIHLMDFSSQIFAVQAWYPPLALKLNSPGWSLSVEALFYLTFPLIFNFFYSKYPLKSIVISVIFLWIITQIAVNYLSLSSFNKGYLSNSQNFIFYFPLLHINEFLVGNMVGYAYLRYAGNQRNFDFPILLVFTLLLIALSFKATINYQDGLMAVIFAPLILLLSLNNGKISQLFSSKYLIILGEASYSIYIIQVPIDSCCHFLFKKFHFVNQNGIFYIYLITLITVSLLCYYMVEIPAKNWIKSFKNTQGKKAMLTPQ